jgi:hypothetical protein
MVATTPSSLPNGGSIHQKQPPAKVALARFSLLCTMLLLLLSADAIISEHTNNSINTSQDYLNESGYLLRSTKP